MSRPRFRQIASASVGVAVATFALWGFTAAATWSMDDEPSRIVELPLGWWVAFGAVAVAVGLGAAALVYVAFRRPLRR